MCFVNSLFMPRKYRDPFESEQFYHIYHRAVTGERLFINDSDYVEFLDRYSKYLQPYFNTWAYCLIPNHFHFLVKVKTQDELKVSSEGEKTNASKLYLKGKKPFTFLLENQFSRMLSGIALRHNKKYNRHGPLFDQGIKRVCITSESRIAYQIAYIHHNPIHHNVSKSFSGWKYSSYSTFIDQGKSKIAVNDVLQFLGNIETFHLVHREFKLEKEKSIFLTDQQDR
jgi:REP element-mobilizing transposase RayT